MKRMTGFTALLACAALHIVLAACSNSSGGVPQMVSIPYGTLVGTEPATGHGNGNGSVNYEVVTFGLWPQTIKAADVTVDESETNPVGEFTYYKGSDGEWYAKLTDKYFKVEPIKWRVLTTDYNGSGKKLLHAEKCLIAMRFGDEMSKYQNSTIRKWLNSNTNTYAYSDYNASGGFLKTAFTAAELAKIADTSVDNSARSTNPDADANRYNNGINMYASDTPTTDKVFLLSCQELTKSAYGFEDSASANSYVYESVGRIRQPTEYAKASGASVSWGGEGRAFWWMRSLSYWRHASGCQAETVSDTGVVVATGEHLIAIGGVVPALCLEN
ncbi:MAG: DUF6273 domain-containing protein [Treponema sp.]|nr:DUF6273 domain-containing protein [Treponema sp.]